VVVVPPKATCIGSSTGVAHVHGGRRVNYVHEHVHVHVYVYDYDHDYDYDYDYVFVVGSFSVRTRDVLDS
jgi:hypothetical protein